MPSGFALDTNVYIDALRNRGELGELKTFLSRYGSRVWLLGVVATELAAGALSAEQARAVDSLIHPYASRDRVLGASFSACRQAGRVLAALAMRERVRVSTAARSLTNDVLLAASCREAGVVLVTRNVRDFSKIRTHLAGFRFAAPWL
ncbi:MAG: type II toxin-antitoxin system VapC family toxin [Gemmatimonadaceae bacterium]